jgi:hypothetical protein
LARRNDILEQLEKVTDRRKSFIYVSEGYHFDPFRNARYKLIQEKYGYDPDAQKSDGSNSGDSSNSGSQQTDPLDDPYYRQGNAFAEADLVNELAQLVNAAKRFERDVLHDRPARAERGSGHRYEQPRGSGRVARLHHRDGGVAQGAGRQHRRLLHLRTE